MKRLALAIMTVALVLATSFTTGESVVREELPFDDFDDWSGSFGYDSTKWAEVDGIYAGDTCGAVSTPNAAHFRWIPTGPRELRSHGLNLYTGGSTEFALLGGSAPLIGCFDPQDKHLVLEYSVDEGQTWTSIREYSPDLHYAWSAVVEEIPAEAWSSSTILRWVQWGATGNEYTWVMDNLGVYGPAQRDDDGDGIDDTLDERPCGRAIERDVINSHLLFDSAGECMQNGSRWDYVPRTDNVAYDFPTHFSVGPDHHNDGFPAYVDIYYTNVNVTVHGATHEADTTPSGTHREIIDPDDDDAKKPAPSWICVPHSA